MEENKESKSKNKIVILTILILILIMIAVATGVILYNKNNNINVNENGESIIEDQEIENKNNEIEKVKNALSSYTDDIGNIEDLVFDSNYNNDYRFNQTHKGIEVYGGGIVATYNDDQIISLINYNYEIPEDFNVSPLNDKDDLVSVALKHLGYENITPSESKLIIFPINLSDYTLAYLYDFNGIKVVVSDNDKTVLGSTIIYNGTTIDKSITDVISDGINNTIKNNENNADSVLNEKDNTTAIEQPITEVFPDIIQKNYDELVKNNNNITQEETKEFIQNDGTYLLNDEERNIEFHRIKNSYELISSDKFLEENTEYYNDIKWDNIQEANFDDNYYAIKAMKHLQNVYDYYKNKFQHISIKEKEENKLKVYTNFSRVCTSFNKARNFSDNACLVYFNEDDIRIYLGSTNLCSDDLEILAHEYTHGYFNRIVNKMSDNETNSVNEAYSDIMGMIIEAYYGNNVLDGIHHEGGGEGYERNIKDSQLKYTDYNEETEYHESSMIVSKIAYLMSINESLDLDINELSDIWFKSMYKLPKHYVKITDVEKAVLLQAKELGYNKEQIRTMADIFVSMGYPDCFEECYGEKLLNVRKINFLDKDKAVALIKNNNGNTWRDVELEYEYVATVMDEKGNSYYAINRYAKENFMYYGGEWLEEITEGKFYAGTYYVSSTYMYNKVHVGYNARDYGKYKQGDTISFFIISEYLNVN